MDSNACIYILEGLSIPLRQRVEALEPGRIVTSSIVYAEVMRGIDRDDQEANAKASRLFELIPALAFDTNAAEVYRCIPFKRGKFDRLIGAHALSLGLTVITNDISDFDDIPGLNIENWTLPL
nr:type II toxin-antitoxin system VapC family toxin [Sphingobium boeckii]